MFTILGGDGKEYGPVTAGKIHEWIAGGRANLQTKARREGETEWKALGDFSEFNPARGSSSSTTEIAPPLANDTPAPTFSPSVPKPATPTDAATLVKDLIARSTPLDVFECLSQSFKLWTSHFLPLTGVTLLIVLIQVALSMIPFLGFLTGAFLNGVFYGGLYYYYLGKIRGEPREVGDAFSGFSNAFVPLMLASLLLFVIILVPMVPFFTAAALAAIAAGGSQAGNLAAIAGGGVLLIFGITFLVVIYIAVSSIFTFPLIIDKGLSPWAAFTTSWRIVNHQWFRVFFVMFLGGLMSMLGVLGLFIGVFFTIPLGIGAIMHAYEALFNPPAPTEPSLRVG